MCKQILRLFKWLYAHKAFILMVVLNGLLLYGLVSFSLPNEEIGLPENLQIPTSRLVCMSLILSGISILMFLAMGWWILKKYPHPESHGFFKFAWICLIPAMVLGISSVSVAPNVPTDSFSNLESAISYFEKVPIENTDPKELKEVSEQINNGLSRLKSGLVAHNKGQVRYYLMRLHQGFFCFLAACINLIFAFGFHLACSKQINKR